MGEYVSRRQVLATAGLAAAGGVVGVGLDTVAGASKWSEVASPTSKTLYEVVTTDNGPYAVGGSGVVVHRTSSGGWEVVVSDGPKGQNKTLHGAAVTDDGNRLWMCGSSGALGEYDVSTGELVNHSNPSGVGETFTDAEVVGAVGDERIYLTMGSGKVVVGKREKKDKWEWDVHDTGGGTTLNAVDFYSRTEGHVVSNGVRAFKTTDGGKTWRQVGIEDAQNPLYGLVSGPDHVYVSAGNGQLWREDCTCAIWTPHNAGSKDLNEIEHRNGEFLAAGNSGRIVEVKDDQWVATKTPVGSALLGCLIGDPDIAVGKSGTIIER